MTDKFKIGELLKSTESNRCFKVFSLSSGGITGATSVFNEMEEL